MFEGEHRDLIDFADDMRTLRTLRTCVSCGRWLFSDGEKRSLSATVDVERVRCECWNYARALHRGRVRLIVVAAEV